MLPVALGAPQGRPPSMWTQQGRAFALSHPAAKQVDSPLGPQLAGPAGGGEYNIWCAPAIPGLAAPRRALLP